MSHRFTHGIFRPLTLWVNQPARTLHFAEAVLPLPCGSTAWVADPQANGHLGQKISCPNDSRGYPRSLKNMVERHRTSSASIPFVQV
jgi:hypothetical protein